MGTHGPRRSTPGGSGARKRTPGGGRGLSSFGWPQGFSRVPDEPWTREPVDPFGAGFDAAETHAWSRNFEPVVAQLAASLDDGDVLVDFSGGTGILTRRLLPIVGDAAVVIVDSSPKFLRVALERLHAEPRVAFRLLPYLKDEQRMCTLDEVLDEPLRRSGVACVVSTNAIHLYADLDMTLTGWQRSLRAGGHAIASSPNIDNPNRRSAEWLLDNTVAAVNEMAAHIVREEPLFEEYRSVLADPQRMAAYTAARTRVFPPVRPLDAYTAAFERTGFQVQSAYDATIQVRVREWADVLRAYHEGVLAWVGGTEKIDGRPPSERALRDRHFLIGYALERATSGRETFDACYTYITCKRR